MTKPILALDCDGILLDFNLGYARVWALFSGQRPSERDPQAYWHFDRWDVPRLDGERRAHLRTFFDENFWSGIEPVEGAVEACNLLHDSGHELVCVTALEEVFAAARLKNLRAHGFPIERVLATGNAPGLQSPKASVIHELRPVAFVDDYLPFMHGIDRGIHTALILRSPNGSPNIGSGLDAVNSTHADLAAFSTWWIGHSSKASI